MDNNQQTPDQPMVKPAITAATAPDNSAGAQVTNLGVNAPNTIGAPTPLSGSDVSMTDGLKLGGPIVSTEAGSATSATKP